MMKLYWAPRTRSLRALWVLEEAGVPYERVRLDLATGEQKSEAFRAINPMAKVPALTDGDLAVAESGAIIAYVAEAVPQAGLAPAIGDPLRGRYLQWLFFSPGCIEQAFLAKWGHVELRSAAAGYGEFDRVFDVLEAAIEKSPWLLGDKFSAADVLIGADVYFGMDIFKVVPSRPALRAYVDRCLARPALQRAKAIEAKAV
ncbi:MAG: glutathione S-transferase family protein [Alphaproteobacteria bacterium]|nr:glutathione S-transferase family protein [Alphaproteobacteria bacterium]MCL2452030.1 glutathione S-transferase family protein [Alphaproteobacteria bacterium]